MGKSKISTAAIVAAMASAAIQPPAPKRSVTPAAPKVGDAKSALLAEFNASLASVRSAHDAMGTAAKVAAEARGGFKGVVARMKASGLFTDAELVSLCRKAQKDGFISDSGASRALTSVGITQRAPGAGRPPKGGKGGDDKGGGEPEIIPAAPSAPLTADALAKLAIAKLGKEAAMALLSEAFHLVKASA